MAELSKDEEAAFAAMANEQAVAEPEPDEAEIAETEQAEGGEGEAGGEQAEGQEKRARFVPHEALHEERTKRQALEAENRRLSEERTRFDERLKIIQEMNQRREEPKNERPAEDDWAGRLEYAERKLDEIAAGGEQQRQLSEQQRQQIAWEQHVAATTASNVEEFKATTPDYNDALSFYEQSRARELSEVYGFTSLQVVQQINRERAELIDGHARSKKNVAETVYKLAKLRGFQAKGAGETNGAAEHVERIATGQQRSQTLSSAGGGAAPTEMTAQRLIDMSPEEFDAWTTKNPAKAARLMGKEPPRRRA